MALYLDLSLVFQKDMRPGNRFFVIFLCILSSNFFIFCWVEQCKCNEAICCYGGNCNSYFGKWIECMAYVRNDAIHVNASAVGIYVAEQSGRIPGWCRWCATAYHPQDSITGKSERETLILVPAEQLLEESDLVPESEKLKVRKFLESKKLEKGKNEEEIPHEQARSVSILPRTRRQGGVHYPGCQIISDYWFYCDNGYDTPLQVDGCWCPGTCAAGYFQPFNQCLSQCRYWFQGSNMSDPNNYVNYMEQSIVSKGSCVCHGAENPNKISSMSDCHPNVWTGGIPP